MSNWGEVYHNTLRTLEQAGFEEAATEAKMILAHVYGGDFSQLYLRFFDACNQEPEVQGLTLARLSGRPLAYVLGEKYFYGRRFYVDERVLIPRYDTEPVVEKALELSREHGYIKALDLCCGSGVIGVTLAAEGRFGKICFADLSAGALEVAKENARALVPDQCCSFVQGDFLENIHETFDLVVCNPPYISARDYKGLEPQVRDYEPQSALLAANEGYLFYERAAKELPPVLNPGGAVVFEIGDTQETRVCALLEEAGFDKIESGCDMAGRPRFVCAVMA